MSEGKLRHDRYVLHCRILFLNLLKLRTPEHMRFMTFAYYRIIIRGLIHLRQPLKCIYSGSIIRQAGLFIGPAVMVIPSRIHTVKLTNSRRYVPFQRFLFDKSSIAKLKICYGGTVVCDGSPSRNRKVRRISLGMTILPRSSTPRTMPVAFIYFLSSL